MTDSGQVVSNQKLPAGELGGGLIGGERGTQHPAGPGVVRRAPDDVAKPPQAPVAQERREGGNICKVPNRGVRHLLEEMDTQDSAERRVVKTRERSDVVSRGGPRFGPVQQDAQDNCPKESSFETEGEATLPDRGLQTIEGQVGQLKAVGKTVRERGMGTLWEAQIGEGGYSLNRSQGVGLKEKSERGECVESVLVFLKLISMPT